MRNQLTQIISILLLTGATYATSAGSDFRVTAWNNGTSTAVVSHGAGANGETWFTCNGSSSSECVFLLFQTSCDARAAVNAGAAAASSACPVKEISRFAVKIGQSHIEKLLPASFQVCAGSKAPIAAPACVRQAQAITPVSPTHNS